MKPDLRAIVFENLAAAAENGHQFVGMTAEEIADDMNRYCADVEQFAPSDLVPHIVEWLQQKTGRAS
jgi:hypothetical protein